jgi:hypothetical protein
MIPYVSQSLGPYVLSYWDVYWGKAAQPKHTFNRIRFETIGCVL